jgi:hypothetical protein
VIAVIYSQSRLIHSFFTATAKIMKTADPIGRLAPAKSHLRPLPSPG